MSAENDDQKPRPDDDKVGYCKPPKHSQFQPGQSGNSRGRPKKNHSIEAMIKRELDRRFVVTEGGRELCISKREAIVKVLVNRALKGETKSLQLILAHLDKHKEIEPFSSTEADDAELLRAFAMPIGDERK